MLFETEKKAENFIKFNAEEIKRTNGRAPVRTYFCEFCGGWHVTSRPHERKGPTKTEKVISLYNKEKQRTK